MASNLPAMAFNLLAMVIVIYPGSQPDLNLSQRKDSACGGTCLEGSSLFPFH